MTKQVIYFETHGGAMNQWECQKCGYKKSARCKPRTCPECLASIVFVKA